MARYPLPLLSLIEALKKLPGVGNKTAERFAFQMISWNERDLQEMGSSIASVKKNLQFCPICRALIDVHKCPFCTDDSRQKEMLCIVASPKDVFQIEETGIYKGLYHVLGALLSPISGFHEEGFDLAALKKRIQTHKTKEVILAIDATLEGDATALYLREMLDSLDVSITRLALGLPIGSPLDFIDGGTLSRAMTQRNNY